MRVQELQEIIGKNLKELRTAKGWSQAELAEKAHVSPDFLSRAERGKRAPSTASLCRLAEALGVPPAELMAADSSPQPSRSHRDLELLLRGVPDKTVKLIWSVARLILDDRPQDAAPRRPAPALRKKIFR